MCTVWGRRGQGAILLRPTFRKMMLLSPYRAPYQAYVDDDFDVDGGVERLYLALTRDRLNFKTRLDPVFAFSRHHPRHRRPRREEQARPVRAEAPVPGLRPAAA